MSETLDLTGLVEKTNASKVATQYFENTSGEIVAKRCRKCTAPKSLNCFAKDKNGLAGTKSVCKECIAKYDKKRYDSNPEEMRRVTTKWRKNNGDYFKKYAEVNREQGNKRNREWRARNKERYKEYRRLWNESNKGKTREYRNRYYSNNYDKVLRKAHRRRLKIISLPNDFVKSQEIDVLRKFSYKCALTGEASNRTWDHAIPLNSGHGGTTYGNMYPLRGDLNSSKGDRNIFEWFKANRQRFNLSQAKFDSLIDWLAETNDMTVEEYTSYVYECHGENLKEA